MSQSVCVIKCLLCTGMSRSGEPKQARIVWIPKMLCSGHEEKRF